MCKSPYNFNFCIKECELEEVENFTYLGSSLSENATVDREISIRIVKASTTFGRLTNRLWKNRHLSLKQKLGIQDQKVGLHRPQESKLCKYFLYSNLILGSYLS